MTVSSNNPPDMTITAAETATALSDWMMENPVIQTEESAREAKIYVDRGRLCIKDLDDERDQKVRPLNEKVKEINNYYRSPKEILSKILQELGSRLTFFIREEEHKRIEAAFAAKQIADEAEQRARDAERAEQDALGSANSGVLGIDVVAAVVQADSAFGDYQVAARAAALAEKESHVRIGGGFSRAIGLRSKEELIVINAISALTEMGATDDIKTAIIKAARAYRKITGKLPDGVVSHVEESI